MSRIRTLTTALAILALSALTANCAAGRAEFSLGQPTGQPVAAVSDEEGPEADDVAEVPWDRCDGACRFEEARRMCPVAPLAVIAHQRRQNEQRFMQFQTRQSFLLAVTQGCVRHGGRVRYAYNDGPGRYGPARYPADRILDSLGPNGRVEHKIRSPGELTEAEQKCGFMATVRGRHVFAVSQRCLAKEQPEKDDEEKK
jgi:hypothetical protein